jgi:hypothetical protein
MYMPTSDIYQRDLQSRPIKSMIYLTSQEVEITWQEVDNHTLMYSELKYMDTSDPDNPVERTVRIENSETVTVGQGLRIGTPFYVRSNFKPDGVEGVYIDSNFKEYDPETLDYPRTEWKVIYTPIAPATDGKNSLPAGERGELQNAHIDDIYSTFLSLAKPGKNVNGSNNSSSIPMCFIIDLQMDLYIDHFRIRHRPDGDGLKVWGASIFGANEYLGPVNKFTNPTSTPDVDNTNWDPIRENITIPKTADAPIISLPRRYYRYIKVVYTDWDRTNNSACQIAEFYLGISRNPI